MAKPIAKAIHELKHAMLEISFLQCALDSLVVFLVSLLVFMLLTLPWWYAFAPFLIYAVLHTYRNVKSQKLAKAEETVPELDEQLRTVADNLDKENEIIEKLNSEVLKNMKKIRTSYFFSFGRLTRELLMIAIVSFLIIGASAYNVQFLDFKKTVKDLAEYQRGGEYALQEELLQFEENLSDDIYGNESIAELGGQELQLQLNPSLSDIDISQIKDPEHREFRSTVPTDITGTTDVSFEETIPKGYQKIVKSYFREIVKTR